MSDITFTDMYDKESYMNDPFFKCSDEEMRNMTQEEFCALIREHNEYVREEHRRLQESNVKPPKFNTIEELRAYYHCMPLDEAINKLNKLFEDYNIEQGTLPGTETY